MAKPAGAQCNLACRYCFYLPKAGLYPERRPRMDDGLLAAYVGEMLEFQPGPEVTFAWQGGEPTLMGLPFYKRAVELQRQLARPGQTVRNILQTNGSLLDEAWCAFLKENDFLLGVSLDGPRDLHDAYRVDPLGRGTHDQLMRSIRQLQDHGVDFNILCTVHAANGDAPLAVYRFLRDEVGAGWMQFIPIVERGADGTLTDRSIGPEPFGRFLVGVFDEWVRHDVGNIFVQEIEVAFNAWMGRPPALCVHAPTCGLNVAMEHNGDVYACDHFVDPEHYLGTIRDASLPDLVFSEPQRRFGKGKQANLPDACRECNVRFACHGGCPKDRFLPAGGGPRANYLCPGYRRFFRHVAPAMELMRDLVNRGRPAKEVMWRLETGWGGSADVGRNAPCPCGSGRKYKRCHGVS